MPMHAPLFERFGGLPAVSRLVLDFYDRVLASERLQPYFRHADMRRLIEHQAKFISSIMGGPDYFSDSDLREIHAHLEIDEDSFDEMVDLFEAALAEFDLEPSDAAGIVGSLRSRRDHVLGRGAA